MYRDVLKYGEVLDDQLSATEKEKLEKYPIC